MPNSRLLLAIFVVVLLPARDAHAYIDPGTGSFIFQMLVASVLGAIFTVKLWFGAAKRLVGRLAGAGGDGADAGSAELSTSESNAKADEEPTEGA